MMRSCEILCRCVCACVSLFLVVLFTVFGSFQFTSNRQTTIEMNEQNEQNKKKKYEWHIKNKMFASYLIIRLI